MSVSRFLRARLCLALFALAAASGAHAAPGDFLTPEFLLNPDHSGNQYSDLASDAAGRILAIGEPISGTNAHIARRRNDAEPPYPRGATRPSPGPPSWREPALPAHAA